MRERVSEKESKREEERKKERDIEKWMQTDILVPISICNFLEEEKTFSLNHLMLPMKLKKYTTQHNNFKILVYRCYLIKHCHSDGSTPEI